MVGLMQVLHQESRPLLEKIKQRGTLVVAMRRSPAVYLEGPEGPDGFEYALTQAFAAHLGVKLRAVFPDNLDQLFAAVASRTVDMASAGLTATPGRLRKVAFSAPYLTVVEQMIYRAGSRRPKTLDEIVPGDLHVVADSSHEETLIGLRDNGHPGLTWQRHPDDGTRRLLSEVESGAIRLTVANANTFALDRRLFPHIATAFELGGEQPIAWAFARGNEDSLRIAANDFLAHLENNGSLERLRARFFGHTGRLNLVDARAFWRHVNDRLPTLQALFEQAGELNDLDWRLLAAIGYQESHWRAEAVSPTGVRGIMMLTQTTAKRVGVKNRSDPAQSIAGGARYLRIVEKKIPQRIQRPDRLWLTLAGYNIGFGHLEDARILTQRAGDNPDLWLDVKKHLPLLTKPEYHKTVRHGFARGQEAVDYVDNIRNYYDMLIWHTNSIDLTPPSPLRSANAPS
jgi:membrane-bound lytic murein transglycosylase F